MTNRIVEEQIPGNSEFTPDGEANDDQMESGEIPNWRWFSNLLQVSGCYFNLHKTVFLTDLPGKWWYMNLINLM